MTEQFSRVRRSDGVKFDLVSPGTVAISGLNVVMIDDVPGLDYGTGFTVDVSPELNTYAEFRAWTEAYDASGESNRRA